MLLKFAQYLDRHNPELADRFDSFLFRLAINNDVRNFHQQNQQNLYEVLGIHPEAQDNEIKSAFRSLARQYHPDVNPNDPDAENKFKMIGLAHDTLIDADNRRLYNEYLEKNKKKRPHYVQHQPPAEDTNNNVPNRFFAQARFSELENKIAGFINQKFLENPEGFQMKVGDTIERGNPQGKQAVLEALKNLRDFAEFSFSYKYVNNFLQGSYYVITCKPFN